MHIPEIPIRWGQPGAWKQRFCQSPPPHPVLTQTSREALMFVELLRPYAYFRKCPVFLKHLKECRSVHGPPSYPAGGR